MEDGKRWRPVQQRGGGETKRTETVSRKTTAELHQLLRRQRPPHRGRRVNVTVKYLIFDVSIAREASSG